jgi:hypothetical protein
MNRLLANKNLMIKQYQFGDVDVVGAPCLAFSFRDIDLWGVDM